ncbi:MAG: ectonucleotide pyrophosphatase/phosphodiesterase [Gemmatimonadota bacterium]|nr:ectonucleotide pyrophosphatase/phosphodiesterase [Gemmatimonadota bacterium]
MSGALRKKWSRACALIAVVALLGGSCASQEPDGGDTVILIGLDAMGWDFRDKTDTPNLDRLVARGVMAERLVPVFPTKTFPNHYSIVTGLHVEDHGIIANSMYDPAMDAWFSLGNRDAVTDPRWWGGEPIWVTAEKQGLTAAAFFWPGTETAIQGVRPTFWNPYDGSIPNTERVNQVLAWLDLPLSARPALITLYFSDVDDAAHRSGTESEETRAAIRRVDAVIGELIGGLEARGIADAVNIIVASDHGMVDIALDRVIFLDDYLDLERVTVVDWNPVASLRPPPDEIDLVYRALDGAHPNWSVYRKDDIPDRYHYRQNGRVQPILVVADEGWSITSRDFHAARPDRHAGANHGYDNQLVSMGATFIAAGPAFRRGEVVPPFQNIHIYEMLCAILDLTPAANAGSLDSVRAVLR